MAWRPNEQFMEGVLDNTIPGRVTGWMRFAGVKDKVVFDLEGDFHRDIRGARVRLHGEGEAADVNEAEKYMEGFSLNQKGKVGDMTAGREPVDYVNYGYFEWYSQDNGRVVIELDRDQVELLTSPIPACESDPISRQAQTANMVSFLDDLTRELNIPSQNVFCVGTKPAPAPQGGMELLTQAMRQSLPSLGSQEGKLGKSIAYAKFFTPSANWTWYVLEGQSVKDETGRELDYEFFGLVDGMEKELGYFFLSELQQVRGPMGLPIERDLYWQPKTLAEIAPEMFRR